MSLRRFRIKEDEYEAVLKWLRKQKVDEAEDEKSAEPLEHKGFRMPADYLHKVPWAHKTDLRIKKIKHGRYVIELREGDVWKRLMHEGEIDGFLRENLLSEEADVPMSRDAGYHIVQKRTVGISRRAFAKFISKQTVLQITRDALPQRKGTGYRVEQRGNLEVDLVEAKNRDIKPFVHHPIKDFYWITLIDRLTGYLEVDSVIHKGFEYVVPVIKKMIGKMEKALKTKVKYIRSDSGSEFKSETQQMLKQLGIRHKFVKSGNRLEQANKTFQKIWYRLMRLGRGDIDVLDGQAQAIFNNTLSSVNGRTPLEALETPDAALAKHVREFLQKKKRAKYKVVPLEVGDKVRYLLDKERGKHKAELMYKSYRGKHWSEQVYDVVKYNKYTDSYYVASKYRRREKLLKVPGTDTVSRDAVAAKHAARKKKQSPEAAGYEWN